jgi:hypothetical protein
LDKNENFSAHGHRVQDDAASLAASRDFGALRSSASFAQNASPICDRTSEQRRRPRLELPSNGRDLAASPGISDYWLAILQIIACYE